MPINFPDSPTTGDTHTIGDKTWTYDGTAWNVVTSSGSDHGNLGGLADDDHTQYLRADGSRSLSGSLLPDTDVTYDLGSSTYRFRDLYLSGNSIDLGGMVISYDGSSVNMVPAGGTSQTFATESYVDTSVSNLVDTAPATLNTLNELAAALGDDANFATTVTNSIALKQDASTALTTSTTFGGDVSGTYNNIVIADDSHNHTIANVDNLQTTLDGKAASSHSHSYLPLTGGTVTGQTTFSAADGVKITGSSGGIYFEDRNGDGSRWVQYHDGNFLGLWNGSYTNYLFYNDGYVKMVGTNPYLDMRETVSNVDVHIWMGQEGTNAEGFHQWYQSATGHTYLDNVYQYGNVYLRTVGGSKVNLIAHYNGNVGIDYDPPQFKLHSGSDIHANGVVSAAQGMVVWGNYLQSSINGTYAAQSTIQFNTDTYWGGCNTLHTGFMIASGGMCGWGTSELGFYGSNNWASYYTSSPALKLKGTGTYPNLSGITVAGTIYYDASGRIGPSASRRAWKENITHIAPQDSLDRIMRLRPAEFTMKQSFLPEFDDKTLVPMDIQRGFIAEEAEEADRVYASYGWVNPETDQLLTFTSGMNDTNQTLEDAVVVNYKDRAIMSDLVGAVQALEARIRELEAV